MDNKEHLWQAVGFNSNAGTVVFEHPRGYQISVPRKDGPAVDWGILLDELNFTLMRTELATLRAQLAELEAWKADQQQALIKASVSLLNAGYKGDGLVEGVAWLAAQLADAQARLAVAEAARDQHRDEAERLRGIGELPITGDGHRFGMAHKLYVNIPNEGGEWTVRRCGVLEIIDPDDRHPEDYEEGQRYKVRIRDSEGEEHEVFMGSLYSTKHAAESAKVETC